MKEQKGKLFDLCPYDIIEVIKEARKRYSPYRDGLKQIWEELDEVLATQKMGTWHVKEKNDIVKGTVWEIELGEYSYHNKVHKFSLLYTTDSGEVIGPHDHEIVTNDGNCRKKISEFYVYSSGDYSYCKKGEKHSLNNPSAEKTLAVLSVKII